MTATECPFCRPAEARVFYRDALVFGLWDAYPVTPGHALLIPTRHVETWFDATLEERLALLRAIDVARAAIDTGFGAEGYNIGINSGASAGQTVFHLHVHVIPRRRGDVADPRGGVRHVIPGRANYVSDVAVAPYAAATAAQRGLFTGGGSDPLLPVLIHHLGRSKAADIAVAFTLRSGLVLLQPYLQEFLDRNGQLRILTGDYLGATDPDALLRLLDLSGHAQCRMFETDGASSPGAFAGSFHPKAYLFQHLDGSGAAFIGSSNLSRSALTNGIEWNYRLLQSQHRAGWDEVQQAFESLFRSSHSVPLTSEWIQRYRDRRAPSAVALADLDLEPPLIIPTPHVVQTAALQALQGTRDQGRTAGLVVLATGLGKTWLSAFDSRAFGKVLFVAHREEILAQALATYRAIRPHDTLGRYTGQEKSPEASVLFASIQTLSRQAHLDRFAAEQFDYIVVDEFHHAEARTYRRLIQYFKPKFLLGLTATPERTDGADLLALCDNNRVFRCDVAEGIRQELLCPFRYFGVPDTVDYRNIPWRNKKFDEEALTNAVATQARAANALDQYNRQAGLRTLAFCVSQRHADFMKAYLLEHGVRAAAVHAGTSSDPRAESLQALKDGELKVICAVDMFNEGVDVPELDTVLMLRPTESRILWLQQFGRGLRRSDPAKRLTVIDYIGNHRSFLLKPQALFDLEPGDRAVLNLLDQLEAGIAELPPGCEVTYELEVKDILRALLRTGESAVELLTRRYTDFRDSLGARPTAVELFREGYNPRSLRPRFGSWLGFVDVEGGLTPDEMAGRETLRAFLEALETTDMTRSYKMLVLLAMINRNQLPGTLSPKNLADEITDMARHDPRIAADLGEALADSAELQKLLRANPIEAWIGGKGTGGVSYFDFEAGQFRSRFTVPPALVSAAQELVREIVDWRLAEYFQRPGKAGAAEFVLKVSHADGRPILFLPDRDDNPGLPEGWTDIRADDELLSANFVKIAVNVARRPDSDTNALPELLRRWFGADAGKPGTRHQVILRREGSSWELKPLGSSGQGAVPYKAYRRAEIAPLFGLPYSERYWGQGFVRQGNHLILFVTLMRRHSSTRTVFCPPRSFSGKARIEPRRPVKPASRSESIRNEASPFTCLCVPSRRLPTGVGHRSIIAAR
jgi:superfamily II DNA or RNA helicase/diadenosine tetraphosphate (Ap4A) HIT family hydrolase/HKD family nuclease